MARRLRAGLVAAVLLVLGLAPSAVAADTVAPNGTVAVPGQDQVLAGDPVVLSGQATDDIAMSTVHVSIKDRTSGLWLRSNGTFGAFARIPATLSAPGASSTGWSYVFTGPPGLYALSLRATDSSGNVDPTMPWVRFSVTATPPPPPPSDAPNVVLVLTDDQRFDSLWAMPNVQSLLAQQGVTFTNATVANALCCPSRASILKGAYPHTTHVYQNNVGPNGPFGGAFTDSSTIATWLDAAGYRTALVGKYFNGYTPARASYIPPGWDRWVAFATTDVGGGMYTNYDLSVDGTLVHYGATAADYSTDVLANYADDFIRTTPQGSPLFLMFTPYAPHETAVVAPRHTTAFPNLAPLRPPNYDEPDVSDKPAYIRNAPRLNAYTINRLDTLRRRMFQTLLAVDEAVADLVDALADTGRLENTMFVFMSDNGFFLGEHRRVGKLAPYEEAVHVPLVVRYDPAVSTPRSDASLVMNIDLAPTFAALAGVTAPGSEGASMLGLLANPATPWRTDTLIEHMGSNPPSFCAVRTQIWKYVQYATGEEELYDLVADPYELQNVAGAAANAATLASLRTRAHQLCSPPPPGFTFRH